MTVSPAWALGLLALLLAVCLRSLAEVPEVPDSFDSFACGGFSGFGSSMALISCGKSRTESSSLGPFWSSLTRMRFLSWGWAPMATTVPT
jgi:hypothetical protein